MGRLSEATGGGRRGTASRTIAGAVRATGGSSTRYIGSSTGTATRRDASGRVTEKVTATPTKETSITDKGVRITARQTKRGVTFSIRQNGKEKVLSASAYKRFEIGQIRKQLLAVPETQMRIKQLQLLHIRRSGNIPITNIEKIKEEAIRKVRKEVKQASVMVGTGTVSAVEQPKSFIDKLAFKLQRAKSEQVTFLQKTAGTKQQERAGERIVRGIFVLGALGIARGGFNVLRTIARPKEVGLELMQQARHPIRTVKTLGREFIIDPVGTIAEFYTYGRVLGVVSKSVKRSPVGRFVTEELYIRAQPREIRPAVRAIIKGSKAQEAINPFKVKSLKGVDFIEVKSLTRIEAIALEKTLRETDSVVFGSTASRTLSKKKLSIPKDVDLGTKNIDVFNKKFIGNLPKSARKSLIVKRQKIIRRKTGETVLDVKPLNRIIPDRSILTRRGFIPVSGYVTKITKGKRSILPRLRKKAVSTAAEVPTQRIVKVKGIKLVGFGEQTTRKGLGTLQVLIEKNVRRAKDPQAFVKSLEIQLKALKGKKVKSIFVRRKIKTLENALKILKSKEFIRLLESKVKGITKEFPILTKIDVKKLKKAKLLPRKRIKRFKGRIDKFKEKVVKSKRIKKVKPRKRKITFKKKRRITRKKPSRIPKRRKPSKIPSRIPRRRRPSKIPSKIPKRRPSKIPSKIPRKPSKMPPSKVPSRIPSKIRIRPSKIPKRGVSRVPSRVSRIPPSKVPPSKIPFITKPPPPTKKDRRREREKEIKVSKLINKKIKNRQFIFLPDLEAIVEGRRATKGERKELLKVGRIFTGQEIRKIAR